MIASVRRLRPTFSWGALVTVAGVIFLLLAYASVVAFESEIGNLASGVQSDYKVDGYYYAYLAKQAIHKQELEGLSLLDAATAVRPNASSGGIVFLAGLLQLVIPSDALAPTLLGLLLFCAIHWLRTERHVSRSIVLLPFCGLFPYFFIPSKEIFFVIGLLLVLGGFLGRCRILPIALGGALMYLSREEGFFIFIFSCGARYFCRSRVATLAFVMGIFLLYFLFAREAALGVSRLVQLQMQQADLGFCNLGPLNVCVEDASGVEWVYLLRLLSLLALPLKWVVDAAEVFYDSSISIPDAIIRFAVLAQIAWVIVALRLVRAVSGRARQARDVLTIFAFVYVLTYGSVLYFQPSRQVILATTVFAIGLTLVNRMGAKNVFNRAKNLAYPTDYAAI